MNHNRQCSRTTHLALSHFGLEPTLLLGGPPPQVIEGGVVLGGQHLLRSETEQGGAGGMVPACSRFHPTAS